MKTRLIKIGKSRGVRLSKAIIERVGLQDEVFITVENGAAIIRPQEKVRVGWAESCRLMHEHGDDALIDGPLPSLTNFDHEEWEW